MYQAFQFLLMKIFNYNLIKRPDICRTVLDIRLPRAVSASAFLPHQLRDPVYAVTDFCEIELNSTTQPN